MIFLRALLFDFDGLLVDSEPLHYRGFREVAGAAGIDVSEKAYYETYVGLDDRDGFRRIFRDAGRPEPQGPALDALMDAKAVVVAARMREALVAKAGAVEFVRRAGEIFRIGVCSGALREEVVLGLQIIGLADAFADVVAAEDVAHSKPDPEGYRLLLERLSARAVAAGDPPLTPDLCCVLEDTTPGLAAGRGAGCWTVGVLGSEPRARLATSAHLVLDALTDTTPADLAALIADRVGALEESPP